VVLTNDAACAEHYAEASPASAIDHTPVAMHLKPLLAEGDRERAAIGVILVLHELAEDVANCVPLSELLQNAAKRSSLIRMTDLTCPGSMAV
jgi:hypothetical protein